MTFGAAFDVPIECAPRPVLAVMNRSIVLCGLASVALLLGCGASDSSANADAPEPRVNYEESPFGDPAAPTRDAAHDHA